MQSPDASETGLPSRSTTRLRERRSAERRSHPLEHDSRAPRRGRVVAAVREKADVRVERGDGEQEMPDPDAQRGVSVRGNLAAAREQRAQRVATKPSVASATSAHSDFHPEPIARAAQYSSVGHSRLAKKSICTTMQRIVRTC